MQAAAVDHSSSNWWKIALAWIFVGIPLTWGVVETGINALKLFH